MRNQQQNEHSQGQVVVEEDMVEGCLLEVAEFCWLSNVIVLLHAFFQTSSSSHGSCCEILSNLQ